MGQTEKKIVKKGEREMDANGDEEFVRIRRK
jgi:hypothetical protein